jgi:hypothetical protein
MGQRDVGRLLITGAMGGDPLGAPPWRPAESLAVAPAGAQASDGRRLALANKMASGLCCRGTRTLAVRRLEALLDPAAQVEAGPPSCEEDMNRMGQ